MAKYPWYVGRRAELLAQVALQEIFPDQFLQAEVRDVPFDFMVAIQTDRGPRTLTVEVKGTEMPVEEKYAFHMTRRSFERLSVSETPTLFLVANVKEDKLYYGWSDDIQRKGKGPVSSVFCVLPVKPLTKSEHLKIRKRVLG